MRRQELQRVYVGDQPKLACPDHLGADVLAEFYGGRKPCYGPGLARDRKVLSWTYVLTLTCTECGRVWQASMNREEPGFPPDAFIAVRKK